MFDLETYLSGFLDYLTEPFPILEKWEEVRSQMIVHTRGVYPTKIIEEKRPNEPSEVLAYRKQIYEPVTRDPILRGLDSLSRIIENSNFRISIPKTVEDYLSGHKIKPRARKGSVEALPFFTYMSQIVLRLGIEDPNGALVWLPFHPEGESLPPSLLSPTEQVVVDPVYVPCSRIRDLSDDVFSYQASELVTVFEGGQNRGSFPAYWVITTEDIVFLKPTSVVEGKPRYSVISYYSLSGGEEANKHKQLPVLILGGQSMEAVDNWVYYDSFFSGYVPPANDAIRAKSDDDAVRVRMNFPIVEEKGQKCHTCRGAGFVSNPNKERLECTSCGGSGLIAVSKGSFSTYIAQPPSSQENPEWSKKAAIQFHHPDVAILERSEATWRGFLRDAEKAVNLLYIEEAQSGIAKEIDREGKYDMLSKITRNFLDNLVRGSLDIIEAYLVPSAAQRKGAAVALPTHYQIQTAESLTKEITELKAHGAPAPLILAAMRGLNDKLYNHDQFAARISEILEEYDSLLPYDPTQINQLRAAGGQGVSDLDVARHTHAPVILARIAKEMGERFLSAKSDDIIEQAEEKLSELMEKGKPSANPFEEV